MRDLAGWLVLGSFATLAIVVISITAGGLWLGFRAYQAARQARPLRLRIGERIDLSGEAFAIRLYPLRRWQRLPAFHAGQHVVLQVSPRYNKKLSRAYSIAAWQKNPNYYELAIKRAAEGQISRWLYEHGQPGLVLGAGAPKGLFHAPPAPLADEVILIAGGIGITPMRAMLHYWRRTQPPPRVMLHFSARSQAGLYFHDEFAELAKSVTWFDYRPHLTQPPARWRGGSGRLAAADVLATIADTERVQVYVCAVAAMENAIVDGLIVAGLDPRRLHRESFGLQVGRNDVQAAVTFEGRRFAYDGAPTLLHALLAQNFDIPAECRAGECGRCRLAIVRGTARDLLTGREEHEAVLTCCSVPTSDIDLRR